MTKELLENVLIIGKTPLKLRNGLREKCIISAPKCRKDNKHGKPFFKELRSRLENTDTWQGLQELFFFNDISNHFRRLTDQFDTSLEKIYYINYLLHLPGMVQLKDHLLYDMNRLLRSVLKELDNEEIILFLSNILSLFKELKEEHANTVLDVF